MNPLVSIIIPAYNKEAYVAETIDSALAQTYSHTEIILINDGSTDNSMAILEQYQARCPEKILLFDQENQGVSATTNKGIMEAKGEYIQFLDADDIMSNDKIQNQINLLKEEGKNATVHCKWSNFKTSIKSDSFYPFHIYRNFDLGIDWLLTAWNYQEMTADSSWLVSRELVDLAGPWNEDLTINQDGEFFCRVLLNCSKVIYDNKSSVYYRSLNEGNVSQQKSEKSWCSLLMSYSCYQRDVLKVEDSPRVRKALKKVYQKFIYDVFPEHSDLIAEAENHIQNLGISEKTYIGGPKFQTLSKYLGFKNALKLKRLLS
ncbi:glycosyltransferase family A protein [Echinicola sp. 20G]|uniref:glycosyltransferase family 2 protein n=1 Tax=Echinicola sp. 20G TaxID=2781961 RepID=UPI0019106F09|nr:glycosyltransferase family A protein [Echinicola sp. 20G]